MLNPYSATDDYRYILFIIFLQDVELASSARKILQILEHRHMEQQKRRLKQKVRVLKRYHSSNAMINTSPQPSSRGGTSVARSSSIQSSGMMYQDSTESVRSYPVWKSPYCIGTKLGGLIDGSRYGRVSFLTSSVRCEGVSLFHCSFSPVRGVNPNS